MEHFSHLITEIQMYTYHAYIKIYVEKSHRSHFTKVSLDLFLQVKTGLADHVKKNVVVSKYNIAIIKIHFYTDKC